MLEKLLYMAIGAFLGFMLQAFDVLHDVLMWVGFRPSLIWELNIAIGGGAIAPLLIMTMFTYGRKIYHYVMRTLADLIQATDS